MRWPQYEKKKKKKLTDWGRASQCFFLCCMGSWHQTRISRTALALQGKLNSSRDTRVESIVIKLQHAITLCMLKHAKWSFELPYHLKEKIHIYDYCHGQYLPWNRFYVCIFPCTCIFVLHHFTYTLSWLSIRLLLALYHCPPLFFFFNWKGLGKLFLNFRTECEFVFRVRTIEVPLCRIVVFPFASKDTT